MGALMVERIIAMVYFAYDSNDSFLGVFSTRELAQSTLVTINCRY